LSSAFFDDLEQDGPNLDKDQERGAISAGWQ
jgi:hypothetical protein